jgi:hypothetical protein
MKRQRDDEPFQRNQRRLNEDRFNNFQREERDRNNRRNLFARELQTAAAIMDNRINTRLHRQANLDELARQRERRGKGSAK